MRRLSDLQEKIKLFLACNPTSFNLDIQLGLFCFSHSKNFSERINSLLLPVKPPTAGSCCEHNPTGTPALLTFSWNSCETLHRHSSHPAHRAASQAAREEAWYQDEVADSSQIETDLVKSQRTLAKLLPS